MNLLQWTSLALFVVAFALSIWRHINVGIVMLVGTLLLVTAGGVPVADAFASFPGSLVILIIGVTMLFAHAERSGAVTWLVDQAFRMVGGKKALIPWVAFVVGAGLATMGAFPTAPISLLLPIMATLAARHRISYPILGIVTVLASNAAGLSPLSPAGATIYTIATRLKVSYSPWALYGLVMAAHVVLVALILLLHHLLRRNQRWARFTQIDRFGQPADTPAVVAAEAGPTPIADPNRAYRIACLVSLVVFVAVVLIFKLDVGLVALTLTLVLQFAFRPPEGEIVKKVPWNVVLLLAGLVIYFGVMGKIGTLKAIETGLGAISSLAVVAVLLCYLTGLISNMESSTLATLGVMVPIGLGAIHGSAGDVLPLLFAVVMSGAVVVMNPVHIAGALIIANAEEARREQMFKSLLITSFSLTALVPGIMALGAIAVTR